MGGDRVPAPAKERLGDAHGRRPGRLSGRRDASRPAAPPRPRSPRAAAPSPGGQERRNHPRVNLFVNFTLQQVDEWGAVLQEELTVADNVSKGGAHVMTTLDFLVGDVVLMQEAGGGFATRAEIRALAKGPDGIGRLHIKFLDRVAPDRLLSFLAASSSGAFAPSSRRDSGAPARARAPSSRP